MTAVIKSSVTYKRDLNISSRYLRALLHQAWINGNDSDEIHEQPAGQDARNQFIEQLMLREGLAKPKGQTHGLP